MAMPTSSTANTTLTLATEHDLESSPNDVPDDKFANKATEQKQLQVAYQFPEGGLKAWLVVLGCWCTSFASFGYVNSFGFVLDETKSRPQ